MTVWQTITWDVARAGGFTAYLLLAISVIIGLALTLHLQSYRWPRLFNSELHNFVTLLALVFTVVHVLAVLLDPFTQFGLTEILVPMASHYRPLWMALGIVALYLGLAIGLSTWLRPYIGYRWWRRLHVLTLLSFALVTVHGIATGSDTRTGWGVLVYVVCSAVVAYMLIVRLLTPAATEGRSHPGWAVVTAALMVVGAGWALSGPLQAGWNVAANNGNGSGARVALAAGSTGGAGGSATSTLALPISSSVQGTLAQTGPDSTGSVQYHVSATFSGSTSGTLDLRMHGSEVAGGFGGQYISITSASMTLGPTNQPQLYTGQVTNLRAIGTTWRIEAELTPKGSTAGGANVIIVALALDVSNRSSVTGAIQAVSASGGGSGVPAVPSGPNGSSGSSSL